jgi:hypothetical protein
MAVSFQMWWQTVAAAGGMVKARAGVSWVDRPQAL